MLEFVQLRPGAKLPSRGYPGDAGLDLYAAEGRWVPFGGYEEIPFALSINLPVGYWARIVGRSSTLRNRSLLVAEGVIDNGYTGELFAGVKNVGTGGQYVAAGERIAQIILHRLVDDLVPMWGERPKDSARGVAGFGSTGA